MGKKHPPTSKAARDNRANQFNRNNPAYWSSRGVAPPPASPTMAPPAIGPSRFIEESAGNADRISRPKQDK